MPNPKGRSRKNYSPEEIITKLREVEIYCKQGKQLQEAIRQIGVLSATYFIPSAFGGAQ